MPTYEYVCNACGHKFERFHSIMAAPIRRCPECGKAKVKRLMGTGAGLIFKGSGFYITDYRSESYKNSAKSESGTGDKKESKPAESKPAESKPVAESTPAPAPKTPAKPPKGKKDS
jgi:putative FmdB family regulatory protein